MINSKNKLTMIFELLAICAINFFSPAAHAEEEPLNPYAQYRVDTFEIQKQYLGRLAAHQEKLMSDLEEKLSQQKWQTDAIAIMVFILVISGVALSVLQFYKDYKSGGKSSVTLKFGSGSFELSSTVIGVAILAMSFVFFQSYVDRVYAVNVVPISPIDITTYGVNE